MVFSGQVIVDDAKLWFDLEGKPVTDDKGRIIGKIIKTEMKNSTLYLDYEITDKKIKQKLKYGKFANMTIGIKEKNETN